jgi:hypothetical protein
MIETITLDTRKDYSGCGKAHISPLRRGERGNVQLTVFVRRNSKPYDLTGMTAHLVWQAADGKLVGPVPMEVTDPAEGIVSCTLPDACYSAVGMARAYVELRMGAELVDTTDEMAIKVLDCIDADGEQAEEYMPLIAEVRDATDAAVKAAERAEDATDAAVKAATRADDAADGADKAAANAQNAAKIATDAAGNATDAASLAEIAKNNANTAADEANKAAEAAKSAVTADRKVWLDYDDEGYICAFEVER